MEKPSIGSKNGENGQQKCPSEHSEETELCSCQLSELDLGSSVTDSSCYAKVMEKLLDQHKSREEQLMAEKDELKAEKNELKAEKQHLTSKLESEKARADQAEQAIIELKNGNAELKADKQELANKLEREKARADQAEQANVELKREKAVLEEEKHKFEEEKKKQKNMNAIPSNDYHIFSQYCQNIANRHNRYLAITEEHWKSTSSEQTLCSCFKLQQNFDGTFGIYSSFKGKFLENGNTGSELGLTEDCTANSAKFEFQYVGQDMFYDMNRMVKIRSIGGNGYLRLDQSGQQSGDFHVTIIPASKDATVFTLVPAYDLCALLKK